MNHLRLVMIVALVSASSSHAFGENRTWTDQQGRQITAEFVRVHGSNAILKQGNRMLRVPLSNLSEADRSFIQNGGEPEAAPEVDPAGEVTDAPVAENETDETVDDSPDEAESRQWTDRSGNTIDARFVRVIGNQIVLGIGKHEKPFPIDNFIEADQSYVREFLIAHGQQVEADRLDRFLSLAKGSVPAPPAIPSIPEPNYPSVPSGPDPTELLRQQREQMRADEEARRQAEAERQAERDRQAYQQVEPIETHPIESVQPSYPETPQYEEIWVSECMSCNREIPNHIGAGDNCPHCGVYFDYEEDEYGNKEYASGSSSGSFRLRGRGIVSLIVIICGLVGAACRKVFSS